MTVAVKNKSRWPVPWLMLHESLPWAVAERQDHREVIGLLGTESHQLSYKLFARRRGYYQVGPLIINSGDLLGLNRNLRAVVQAGDFIVYPKIVPLAQLGLPTHSPHVVLPTSVPLFEDPARIMGVRDYVWGDNPRHIHWPATAGNGRMAVKQFQPAIARDTAIFLNLNRPDYAQRERDNALELAIVVAASLAHHILNFEKQAVGLNVIAQDPLEETVVNFNLPPLNDVAQLGQILEVLARVQATETARFLDSIQQNAVDLTWGTALIIITSQTSPDLISTLLWAKQIGLNPSLILVHPAKKQPEGNVLNIPVFELWQEEDIATWLTS